MRMIKIISSSVRIVSSLSFACLATVALAAENPTIFEKEGVVIENVQVSYMAAPPFDVEGTAVRIFVNGQSGDTDNFLADLDSEKNVLSFYSLYEAFFARNSGARSVSLEYRWFPRKNLRLGRDQDEKVTLTINGFGGTGFLVETLLHDELREIAPGFKGWVTLCKNLEATPIRNSASRH